MSKNLQGPYIIMPRLDDLGLAEIIRSVLTQNC